MAVPFLIAASLAVLAPPRPMTPLAVAKKLSTEFTRAMRTKDYAFFVKYSTPDFTYTDSKGTKSDRSDALAGMKQGFRAYKKVKRYDERIVSARRAEGGVVVVSDSRFEATVSMGGNASEMVSTGRSEALLVPLGDRWMYKRVKVLQDSTTLDGKPAEM